MPLSNIEYAYGFGVYETIRVTGGVIYFVEDHCERLMRSAEAIGLEHKFDAAFVKAAVRALVDKNQVSNCNLKILLIGAKTADAAQLYIQCLNPLYPDRKLYREGVHCITVELERPYPQAKTLNMLPSYLAYRQAGAAGAYDALLVNRHGQITEGTRTNFFALKDWTLYSPPAADILPGVTRELVLEAARGTGTNIVEQPIALDELERYDAAFVSSTSSKIMPLKSIDEHTFATPVSETLRELMATLTSSLSHYAQQQTDSLSQD